MKRRQFIQSSIAASIPMMLNGFQVAAFPKSLALGSLNENSDRVLVLVQMNGGNDGLSTFIPIDQYANLMVHRPNILIPENSILPFDGVVGVHPSLTGVKTLYEQSKLGVIQSVGYPNQNRSHFRSMDIWTTGSDADEYLNDGWMGRYFDAIYADYPNSYPNSEYTDPFAISIGALVSVSCQGANANFSMAVLDPFAFSTLPESIQNEDTESRYGEELDFLRKSINQTNAYSETITSAAENATNLSSLYADDNPLAQQLKIVAQLIAGGLQTKVYVVNLDGFDTHAKQVEGNDLLQGKHTTLLQQVSDAIFAFQDDLQLLGLEERVLGMTITEFGRRIKSNNSFGSAHGTASPLMVFGTCVNSTILGDSPAIAGEVLTSEGVPMQFDFRSVYASILMDWFGASEELVKTILIEDFQYLPIVEACNSISTSVRPIETQEELICTNHPNPFTDWTSFTFQTKNEWIRLSIFDALGQEVKVITNRKFKAGEHTIKVEIRSLPIGNYYYRLATLYQQKTKLMVKV